MRGFFLLSSGCSADCTAGLVASISWSQNKGLLTTTSKVILPWFAVLRNRNRWQLPFFYLQFYFLLYCLDHLVSAAAGYRQVGIFHYGVSHHHNRFYKRRQNIWNILSLRRGAARHQWTQDSWGRKWVFEIKVWGLNHQMLWDAWHDCISIFTVMELIQGGTLHDLCAATALEAIVN